MKLLRHININKIFINLEFSTWDARYDIKSMQMKETDQQ